MNTNEAADSSCCYLCNQCASSFSTLELLESHLASHMAEDALSQGGLAEQNNSPSSSDGSFPNEDNSDAFNDELLNSSLGTDENSTSLSRLGIKGKIYPCRFCSKLFHSRSLLNIHYTHTHRDKPQYECEDCGIIFSVKRELATHRRIHSGESTHACAQCGKEFGTRQLLKKHWMWHTGQRSHICPHCGKAFFQKGHLTQHLMIHAGGRPHVCKLCNKTFIFKFDLNRHMKIHAERGYSCPKCGRAFLKQTTLFDHQARCQGKDKAVNATVSAGSAQSLAPKVEEDTVGASEQIGNLAMSPKEMQVKNEASSQSPYPLFPSAAQQQRFLCLLCMQELPSQAAYSLHLSYVHLRDVILSPFQQQQLLAASQANSFNMQNSSSIFGSNMAAKFENSSLNNTDTGLDGEGDVDYDLVVTHDNSNNLSSNNTDDINPATSGMLTVSHANVANGTVTTSMQFYANNKSPVLNGAEDSSVSDDKSAVEVCDYQDSAATASGVSPVVSHDNSGSCSDAEQLTVMDDVGNSLECTTTAENHAKPEDWSCKTCDVSKTQLLMATHRLVELEKALTARDQEISRLRQKMRRVGQVAGSLLESCSEFDKLWMLHSKKVYSQIQSVLNSLE